ncbi:MAG: 5-(carboxyamino)imidazole ribonucleotide mutase [Methanobrevibacter sp.]|nr:5-(carboxyamino)imidazole ribonucleotide mutase [Methanobrevibacter sp.]
MTPKVMIILGSASDKKIAEKAIDILETLKIPYSLKVASAHRTHEKVKKLVIEGTKQGVEVFIGIAGLSAHLQGVIASYTYKPVVGVPVDVKVSGLDALYASAQMPFPIPVASVGIDRGENAGILAGQIIATLDEKVKNNITKLRKSYHKKVKEDEEKLINSLNEQYLNKDFLKNLSSEYEAKGENKENDSNTESKNKKTPLVSVIAGSNTDIEIAKKTCEVLDELNISYDMNILSPVRHPDKFQEYIESMKDVKLFLAVSGLSAHVTGAIVALSEKPVIGVPCYNQLNRMNSLLAMINMPPGVPVGTVGVDNGENAGILAGKILGISNKEIESNLKRLKQKN